MTKNYLFFIILLLYSFPSFSSPIDKVEARKIAESFYQQQTNDKSKINRLRSVHKAHFELDYICKDDSKISKSAKDENSNNLYYVFNRDNEQGFVIISGDHRAGKVLAYSPTGNFSHNDMPDNLSSLMDEYKNSIKKIINEESSPNVLPFRSNASQAPSKILPLLEKEGISWNQREPFNNFCPTDKNRNRSLTGCVATAIAQLMRYNKYPQRGMGSHQYSLKEIGRIYANFETDYDWDNMPAKYIETDYTKIQADAVAKLMYHIGVAVEMNYSPRGSAVYAGNTKRAMVKYFGYDKGIDYLKRSFYSQEEWYSIIKKELNEKRPVLYDGYSSRGGHAFVCDGYDSNNLFHINWGWGGVSDGYFDLAILEPSIQGAGGGIGAYSNDQGMLIGIQPPKEDNSSNYNYHVTFDNITFPKNKIINRANTFTIIFNNIRNRSELAHDLFDFRLVLKSDTELYTIHTETLKQFGNNVYYDLFDINDLKINSNIPNGNYQLLAQIKNPHTDKYTTVLSRDDSYRDVGVEVRTTEIEFKYEELSPNIKIVGAPQIANGVFYQNEQAKVSLTLKNEGKGVFRSKVEVVLTEIKKRWGKLSLGKSTVISNISVSIEAGETKTLNLSQKINLNPGKYKLDIRYASPNNEAGPTNKYLYNNGTVQVKDQPYLSIGFSNLKLSKHITRFDKLSASVDIENKGDFYSRNIGLEIYKMTSNGEYRLFKTINQLVTLAVREKKRFTFEIDTDDFTDSKTLKNELRKSSDVAYSMVFKYISDRKRMNSNQYDFFITPANTPFLSFNPESFEELTIDENGKLPLDLHIINSGVKFEDKVIRIEFIDEHDNIKASVENKHNIEKELRIALEENDETRRLLPGKYSMNILYENEENTLSTMRGKYIYTSINIREPELYIDQTSDNSTAKSKLEFNLMTDFTFNAQLNNKGGTFEGELYLDIIPSENLGTKKQEIHTIELMHKAPRDMMREATFTTKLDEKKYLPGNYTLQLKQKKETTARKRMRKTQEEFNNIGEAIEFKILDINSTVGFSNKLAEKAKLNIHQSGNTWVIKVPKNSTTLHIYDMKGSLLNKTKLSADQTEFMYNTSKLNRGIFLVVAEGKFGKIVEKTFVK